MDNVQKHNFIILPVYLQGPGEATKVEKAAQIWIQTRHVTCLMWQNKVNSSYPVSTYIKSSCKCQNFQRKHTIFTMLLWK
jgi:hypothetical protein